MMERTGLGLAIQDDGNSFRIFFLNSLLFCVSALSLRVPPYGRGYGHQCLWGHNLIALGKKRKKTLKKNLDWLKCHAHSWPFTVARCVGHDGLHSQDWGALGTPTTVGENSSSRKGEVDRHLGRQQQWMFSWESWLFHVENDKDAFFV